jgi:glutamate synthase (NADPH/NADH) small chain
MDDLTKKVKGRVQDPSVRVKNFDEVELGFNDEEALKEANRCLHCPKPRCMEGCPVSIAIPEFIQCIKDGNLEEAYKIISQSSSLPAVCGRVCPHEKQCQGHCVLGKKGTPIQIGKLEQFIADFDTKMQLRREKLPQKTR